MHTKYYFGIKLVLFQIIQFLPRLQIHKDKKMQKPLSLHSKSKSEFPHNHDPTSQPILLPNNTSISSAKPSSPSLTAQQPSSSHHHKSKQSTHSPEQSKANNNDRLWIWRMHSNMQQIKLYISNNTEPIPDVVNQVTTKTRATGSKSKLKSTQQMNSKEEQDNIFSHFKFYFNDNQLTISRVAGPQESKLKPNELLPQKNTNRNSNSSNTQDKDGGKIKIKKRKNKWESVTHLQQFEEQICELYRQWKQQTQAQTQSRCQSQEQKQQQKQQSDYHNDNIEVNTNTNANLNPNHNHNPNTNKYVVHRNFITFVEYWVEHTPSLIINYTPYNQLINQCCCAFYQNLSHKVAFSVIGPNSNSFSSKLKANKLQKSSKNKQKSQSELSALAMKRLLIYFTHFTKIQNLTVSVSSPIGGGTFDEINKKYHTINLQQWICFIKSFHFDQIYQQKCRRKAKQLGSVLKGNTKSYLPVKNVKWNSSLHYFKNLFQKFCDNSKNIDFNCFERILKRLFQELFAEQDKLIPISQQQQKQQQQQLKNTSMSPVLSINQNNQQFCNTQTKTSCNSPSSPSSTPIQFSPTFTTGLNHLFVLQESDKQFNNKLRSMGIFVSECPTKIHVDHHDHHHSGVSRLKTYSNVKAKYLRDEQQQKQRQNKNDRVLMSPCKIKQGKGIGKDMKQAVLLPSLHKKQKAQKLYTLSQLMTKKQNKSNNNMNQSNFSNSKPKQGFQQLVNPKQSNHHQSISNPPPYIKSYSMAALSHNANTKNSQNQTSSSRGRNYDENVLTSSSRNGKNTNTNTKNTNSTNNKGRSKLVSQYEHAQHKKQYHEQHQYEQQQDEYLNKYYNINNSNHNKPYANGSPNLNNNGYKINLHQNTNTNTNTNTYHITNTNNNHITNGNGNSNLISNNRHYNNNNKYSNDNNNNSNNISNNKNGSEHSIIRKIDERIHKIHYKML